MPDVLSDQKTVCGLEPEVVDVRIRCSDQDMANPIRCSVSESNIMVDRTEVEMTSVQDLDWMDWNSYVALKEDTCLVIGIFACVLILNMGTRRRGFRRPTWYYLTYISGLT